MTVPPRFIVRAAVLVSIGVVVLILTSGGSGYDLRFVVGDAQGLEPGSPVRIADVTAGTVRSVTLNRRDQVVVDVRLDGDQAPVGRDASVAIQSLNLLAQHYVSIDKGHVRDPAPSGFEIPSSRVGYSTNLNQVLGVLEPNTRARLAIMLNEAGVALAGRRDDVSLLLGQLPHSLTGLTNLLNRLVSDNVTLQQLIDHGDRFINTVNAQRSQFVGLLHTLGRVSTTVASRQQQLSETLGRAPGMLHTAQGFLASLQAATLPLGAAARNLSATAQPLLSTIDAVAPFTNAAVPTLHIASQDAALLTQLGVQATPVLERAGGFATTLAGFTAASGPATSVLNDSEDNIISILENWSHAIQYRDALSHYFRGEPAGTGDLLYSLVDRLMAAAGKAPAGYRRPAAARPRPAATAPLSPAPQSGHSTAPVTPGGLVRGLGGIVSSGLGAVLGSGGVVSKLAGGLQGLLAGHGGRGSAPSGGQPAQPAPPAPPGQKLAGLLNYLLGR
jgi:phospholipid/cholesterol/gamma-HCH transport system substrate-binding protein